MIGFVNNIKFKCDKCQIVQETYSAMIKGSNNTKLCKKCGENVCFICGKKETRKEWIEDVDCCGNKVRREVEVKIFNQIEKQEDNPNEGIWVYYCHEHQTEAQKSPYLFTEAEKKVLREQQEKEHDKKRDQEKRETEERLNNQKNLFFHEGRTDNNREGQIYNVYLGKENGQNYYLMIPSDHPVWKATDPAAKKMVSIIKNEGNYLFLVEGVENIPIEQSPSGYWKYLSSERKSQGITEPIFHKIVEMNHKITFAEADENPEKDKPVKNNPTDNPPNSLPKKPINNQFLLQYFQKNSIKSIKLEDQTLIVEKNDNSISASPFAKFPELTGLVRYLENRTNKKVSRQELETKNNSDNTSPHTKPQDNTWKIGCGIGGTLAIIVMIGLFLRKKKRKNK